MHAMVPATLSHQYPRNTAKRDSIAAAIGKLRDNAKLRRHGRIGAQRQKNGFHHRGSRESARASGVLAVRARNRS